MTSPTRPYPVVLLGGSGLGPWAWTHVATALSQSGLTVRLPDVTSADTGGRGLAKWRDQVLAEIADLDQVTLVAHSFAGYLASAVVETDPARIGQLVLLDAVLPEPGRSFFDTIGADAAAYMTGLAVESRRGQGPAVPWFTVDQLHGMYPRHGMTPQTVAWVQRLAVPQPLDTYRSVASRRCLQHHDVPTTYIRCHHTPTPIDTALLAETWHRIDLASGHWPMFTAPVELTAALTELSTNPPKA